MGDKKIAVQDIIELLEDAINLIKTVTTDPIEIEHIINYALYEYLYPPKRSARDRIIKPRVTSEVVDPKDVPFKNAFKNSHTIAITDDRPCDTEAPTNVVRVDFSND
tara:strand:+ start:813 stop:1133 length:321 start_codon:yes stop_codon:yes gene_type:complete